MSVEGWRYYNHAMIPTCAPHEEPDLTPLQNGDIWKTTRKGRTPLLARWTTDFDCQEETNWWYTVRFGPFCLEELSRSSRKHIRQALKKCVVMKISASQNLEQMYRVYRSAFKKYENADNEVEYNKFCQGCVSSEKSGCEYWGGYERQTGLLIGYMVLYPHEDYVELQTTKLMTTHLFCRISDALYYTVLDYYLNRLNKRYVTSGNRCINHKTHSEEYKIETFGYKRAYCRLHIVYTPFMGIAIKLLYPFRKVLRRLDRNTRIHQVNAVLKMEEIVRNEER